MTNLEPALRVLPLGVRQALNALPGRRRDALEEVRLRCGHPATVVLGGQEQRLPGAEGVVTTDQLQALVNQASGHSAYAAEQQLSQGFLTLPGGHRLGVCGSAVLTGGQVKTLRELSSVNLRLARELPGLADRLLMAQKARRHSLLIVGPPGSGKTTLLRDLVRQLSDELGCRVCLADERGELAAVWQGVPQLDVGRRTDVLSGCPKALAAVLLLRAMNPEFLAVDEITASEDVAAMEQTAYCGTYLLATAHAANLAELSSRPLYARLLELGVFSRAAVLSPDKAYRLEALV